jgi:ABC-type amino acid transport substrate-binding protein
LPGEPAAEPEEPDLPDIDDDDVDDGDEEVAVQPEEEPTDGTLAAVRDRGQLICGVNDVLPGFGFVTPDGEFEGFDIDYCRAVAAAVLGDADRTAEHGLATVGYASRFNERGSVGPAILDNVYLKVGLEQGVAVLPGDVIVGDAEGVIVVPRQLAEEIADEAVELEQKEEFLLTKIESGRSIHGVYPPDDDTLQEFETWKASRS